MSAKKLTILSLFICFAAALSALETMLPPICPIPGVRVGLGNIVTLFALYIGGCWSASDAFTIAVLRCLLAALVTGSPMNAAYGLTGGVFSCAAMLAARRIFPKSKGSFPFDVNFLPFTAVCGAVFHIAGQMLTAVLFYGTISVLAYVPILLASAITGGLFTGFCTVLLLKKLPAKLMERVRNSQ